MESNERRIWQDAPQDILAVIFSYLSIQDILAVRCVCSKWHDTCEYPCVWHTITIDYPFSKKLTSSSTTDGHNNVLSFILDHLPFCYHLQVDLAGFHNSGGYFIFEKASRFCEKLISLKICNSFSQMNFENFASLSNLKQLLSKNKTLGHLDLDGIKVSAVTNNEPMPIGLAHSRTLRRLRLVSTLETSSPSALMYLVNLTTLTISPHLLQFQLIKHLSSKCLKRLNLVMKPRVPESFNNLSEENWRSLSSESSLVVAVYTSTRIKFGDSTSIKRMVSPSMPLDTFVYNKTSWLPYQEFVPHLYSFATTLREFVDFSLFKPYSNGNHEQLAITIAQKFVNLHTLSVRFLLSAGTILTMMTINSNLQNFVIRKDMIMFQYSPEIDNFKTELDLTNDQVEFIKTHSYDRLSFQIGMTLLLGKEWQLVDNEEYCDWMTNKYAYYFNEHKIV